MQAEIVPYTMNLSVSYSLFDVNEGHVFWGFAWTSYGFGEEFRLEIEQRFGRYRRL